MEDSGFMAYRHIPNNRRTADIEGLHALLYRILKGYAGFSTIISLGHYIYSALYQLDWNFTQPAILTPLILIVLPILVIGLIYFPILLHEKNIAKNTLRLKNAFKMKKMIDIPTFDKIIIE